MHLSFPEAEKMGMSYEDVYLYEFSQLDYLTEELQKFHNNDSFNDIPSYVLHLIRKMLDIWESIFLLYSHNKDYVSTCTLCRSIFDNLVTIYHIYMDPNEDEKNFKHYLYVLDGIINRSNNCSGYSEITNNGQLREHEFIALTAQIKETMDSDDTAKEFIVQQLKKSPLYKDNQIINQIIEKGNWKYKSLEFCNPKNNQLKWNSLYKKVDSNPSFSIFGSYLSVFVHGLSVSNFNLEKDDSIFEPILSLSICNLDLTTKAVKHLYKKEIEQLDIDVKKSPAAIGLLNCISNEYLHELFERSARSPHNDISSF